MDYQYSSYYPLVWPLVTALATFADMPSAGSIPICPGTHIQLHPIIFYQFHQGLMTIPEKVIIVWKLPRASMEASLFLH
jgi:hypothetical protein